jgi:hypothetical protein
MHIEVQLKDRNMDNELNTSLKIFTIVHLKQQQTVRYPAVKKPTNTP